MQKAGYTNDSLSVGLTAVALVAFAACAAAANTPIPMAETITNTLTTAWGRTVTPANAWREYPRPQMVRGNWQRLNGEWEFAVTSVTTDAPRAFPERILVPFAVESKLSGVGRTATPNDLLWYRRTFTVGPLNGGRLLLHFERVDYRAQVYVNGVEAMDAPHENGNAPFSLDITDLVREGTNELKVCVWDPTDAGPGGTGKQTLNRDGGSFFGTVSGICGSVWTERVCETYLADWRIDADAARGIVRIQPELRGRRRDAQVEAVVSFAGKEVARGSLAPGGDTLEIALPQPVRLWSCAAPNLYDVALQVRSAAGTDEVKGYFGVRTVSTALDARGIRRVTVNGKFTFLLATLDQGWWPDGLLTPPSEDACRFDVDFHKEAGFNAIRKHIKVEPRVFYAHCDRVGVMVLQDIPSGNEYSRLEDRTASNARYGSYRRELRDCIAMLRNHPCVVMWIPFNEGWGQPGPDKTRDVIRWIKRTDPSRLVDGPSGWNDYEGGFTYVRGWNHARDVADGNVYADVLDFHRYPHAVMPPPSARRVSFCGEFGGLHACIAGHSCDPLAMRGDCHPYLKSMRDPRAPLGPVPLDDGGAWRERNRTRYLELMKPVVEMARKGLGGCVFTEAQDQYWEFMGLMTFDRAVVKFDFDFLRSVHAEIYEAARAGAAGAK